jgi:hypothetical protein
MLAESGSRECYVREQQYYNTRIRVYVTPLR